MYVLFPPDICLLVGTIRLIPENSELLSLGEKILSSVATQHSSSDIVVFERCFIKCTHALTNYYYYTIVGRICYVSCV